VVGEQVIAADSSLGRALTGVRPGQTFRYFSHAGPRIGRLVDIEPSGLNEVAPPQR
jgi:hypothetical protein